MANSIVIVGAGGFGLEVAMLIEQINASCDSWDVLGYYDDRILKGDFVDGYPVLGAVSDLNRVSEPTAVAIAIGDSAIRRKVVSSLQSPLLSFPQLIHPSVLMGSRRYIELGQGVLICAGSILTTRIKLGDFVLVNLACTIGHEAEIGAFSSFMPTCNVSGEVQIGEESFWGTGAKVINRKKVGNRTVIGAGAVVLSDIPDDATAVGCPAKVIKIKQRIPGDV